MEKEPKRFQENVVTTSSPANYEYKIEARLCEVRVPTRMRQTSPTFTMTYKQGSAHNAHRMLPAKRRLTENHRDRTGLIRPLKRTCVSRPSVCVSSYTPLQPQGCDECVAEKRLGLSDRDRLKYFQGWWGTVTPLYLCTCCQPSWSSGSFLPVTACTYWTYTYLPNSACLQNDPPPEPTLYCPDTYSRAVDAPQR